jgi:ElaB/YqjD/DUF883 family membrane-anchored ribosome-binding protein
MRDNLAIVRPGATQQKDDNEAGGDDNARDEIYRLEAEIARKRERVAASLGELRRRVTGATDWRHWVRAHPFAWIAVGVSLGFIIGLTGGKGKWDGERERDRKR